MNRRKKVKLLTLIVFLMSLSVSSFGFGYSGDGEYKSDGFFFRNQLLKLPTFSLDEVGEYVYEMDGFGNGYPNIDLVIKSDNEIAFWKVSTLLEVEIQEKGSNNTVLRKKSRLNSHYSRMKEAGKILGDTDDEWRGFYKYSNPKIHLKSVPFDTQSEPEKQIEIEFSHMKYKDVRIKWYKDYLVKVKIIEPDRHYKNLNAYIQIISGWK